MRLVLDGYTAYEYWMSAASANTAMIVRAPRPQLSDFESLDPGELGKAIEKLDGYPGKLQLLVQDLSQRRPSAHVDCRCWSTKHPFPAESFYQIGSGVYVESPELCLVRLAADLPRLEALRALSDMLGTYGLSLNNRIDLVGREPITSIAKIRGLLDRIPGVRGTRLIDQALRWIVPGAASPRETSMDLALAMPTRMGGHGMPPFEANYHIEPDDESAPLTTKSYLIADVAWSDKQRVLEYNSSKYHDTEEQMQYDFEKITTLQNMGYVVTPVSTRQFNSYDTFCSIVDGVRRDFGMRVSCSKAANDRRKNTHEELLRIERRNRELPSLDDTARWQYLRPRIDVDAP